MSLRRVLCVLAVLTLSVSAFGALTLPADITAEAGSAAGAVVHYNASGTGSGDDENGRPTTQVTCAPASGSLFPLGATTVSCTSADNESGSFTVTVVDTTGPALTLPGPISIKATSSAGAAVSYNASAVDAVDGAVSVSCSPASGSTFPVGTTSVQCSASDSRNNASSGSFTVTVTDPPAPPPPPQIPGDITKEATGPDGATVTYTSTGTGDDDENGRPTTSANCNPASGSKFPLGETTVQCDGGSFKVKVVDTTAPSLNLPRDFSVPGNGSGAVVTYDANAHDLVDGSVAVSCSPSSGSTFATGTTTVQCTSSDSRNNSATGSFAVTVLEQQPPPVLPDLTREATGPNGAVVEFTVPGSGADDENGRPTQASSCAPVSGSTFPLGVTTVTCTNGTFKVTVVDTTAPTLMLPDNITTTNEVVSYTVSALDLVDGSVTVTCTPPSGSTFALGSTVVQCSASDSRNNTATGSFVVTVQDDNQQPDTEAPVIVSISASPDSLKPPNGKLVDVTITVSVTDNADPQPLVRIFNVEANETIAAGDTNVTGLLTVQLRADRNPHGSGRVYTVWVEVIDAAGNRTTGAVTVTVPHDQSGTSQPVSTNPPPGKRRAARH